MEAKPSPGLVQVWSRGPKSWDLRVVPEQVRSRSGGQKSARICQNPGLAGFWPGLAQKCSKTRISGKSWVFGHQKGSERVPDLGPARGPKIARFPGLARSGPGPGLDQVPKSAKNPVFRDFPKSRILTIFEGPKTRFGRITGPVFWPPCSRSLRIGDTFSD